MLSAIEHSHNANRQLAARIASAAIVASAEVDAERFGLYLDLLLISLPATALQMEATMNSLGFEYQSDFARRYFGQGKEEGRVEGRFEGRVEGWVEVILQQLVIRFGTLPDEIQTRVRGAEPELLKLLAERILTARTREEALGPLR